MRSRITATAPVWSGFGPAQFNPTVNPETGRPYTYANDGFEATSYLLSTDQFGTQFDPPAHWAPEQAAIDEVPASYAVRPLVVINIAAEAKKDTIKVGRTALAVGKGYGVGTPTVSQGLVSAVDRASGKAIQTSANVSPACYGGPLVSLDGEIMGVCVPLAGMGGQAGVELYDCGIGFAIPIEDVRAILPRLEKGETLKPAFLGVVVDQGRTEDGILIESVQPKSPADKAGLEDEDVIIEVDGKKAVGHHVLNHAIGKRSAGDKLKLVVLRGKERVELEAKLAEAPKTPPRPKGPPGMPGPGGRPGPNPPGPNPPGPAPGGDDE